MRLLIPSKPGSAVDVFIPSPIVEFPSNNPQPVTVPLQRRPPRRATVSEESEDNSESENIDENIGRKTRPTNAHSSSIHGSVPPAKYKKLNQDEIINVETIPSKKSNSNLVRQRRLSSRQSTTSMEEDVGGSRPLLGSKPLVDSSL